MFIEKINSPQDLKKLSIDQLSTYANEVRNFIIESVHKNGGHLSSNLGAVELSIALHYVFDSPLDKLIFDVGHQSYTHKLITGRAEILKNLRTNLGASGFPLKTESKHDHFTSGHSSNSLSLALGLARARDSLKQNHHIVPIIGDGAFTGGMIFEALNDIGEIPTKMLIILNDNKMSIAKNVGAMSKYFAKLRLSKKYNVLKQNIKKSFSPFRLQKSNIYSKSHQNKKTDKGIFITTKERVKSLFVANRLFENFSVSYYGPFDGHDTGQMIEVFKKAVAKIESTQKPVIVHLITKKGKGLPMCEDDPEKFHGLSPNEFSQIKNENSNENICVKRLGCSENICEKGSYGDKNICVKGLNCNESANFDNLNRNNPAKNTGQHNNSSLVKNPHKDSVYGDCYKLAGKEGATKKEQSFSKVLADTIVEIANEDDTIVAVTAAMPAGTGLEAYAKAHPNRFFDVSIAEQHAVTLCAGLAAGGLKPIFAVYSTFLQRAFDQILHDVCLNNLPVVFAIDRAGATGSDGVTHQGIFDLSYLNLIPNLTILTPKNGQELSKMLKYAIDLRSPVAIRYPKSYTQLDFSLANLSFSQGDNFEKWEILNKNTDSKVFILCCGHRAVSTIFSDFSQFKGFNIINARGVKPLDFTLLNLLNQDKNLIITLEDNVLAGGFGESVLSFLNQSDNGLIAKLKIIAHKNQFLDNRDIDRSLTDSGLCPLNLLKIVEQFGFN
ncbi:MAG: 1-deoxy-D-xylulose-5-phosphate synthase [Firmicutes bacterium]|nr:1-deoxy-D-xylulose-5-phosphate synthase [Bacillota bacterium]